MKKIVAVVLSLVFMTVSAAFAESTLNVEGNGTVYMEADEVSMTLGVSLLGEDMAKLQQDANTTIGAIYQALQDAGVDKNEISTNYIYISPQYDYSGDTNQLIGYQLNNSISIKTGNIDSIGEYIDIAFAAGANTFDSITFSVKDETQAQKQALEMAVQDAAAKAEVIAGASGKKLGEIISITESANNDGYTVDCTMGGAKAYADSATVAATQVRAAQVSVSANVQISYGLN